jgi:hypothetical protein
MLTEAKIVLSAALVLSTACNEDSRRSSDDGSHSGDDGSRSGHKNSGSSELVDSRSKALPALGFGVSLSMASGALAFGRAIRHGTIPYLAMLNQSLIGYSFRVDTGASQKVGERMFITEDEPGRRDEARRSAANIAKLPELFDRKDYFWVAYRPRVLA